MTAAHPTGHPRRLIRHGLMEAEVDAAIAPLILACWQAGIETDKSCVDDEDGDVCVEFPADAAARFLSAAAGGHDPDPRSLHVRVLHLGTPVGARWRYDVRPASYLGDLDSATGQALEPEPGDPAFVELSVLVRIPRADVDQVVWRLTGS